MDDFDTWGRQVIQSFGQGAGDVSRGAIADVGNAYQSFLRGADISPTSQLTADMVITHDAAEEPATDLELHQLIGESELQAHIDGMHDIGQRMAEAEIEKAMEPEPQLSPDMER